MSIDPRHLLDPAVVQDPYSFYDDLRRLTPVWRAGETNVYLTTAFESLSDAARRVEDFSSVLSSLLFRGEDGLPATLPVALGPPTLSISDPPTHTMHKQLIFPRFVSKRMALIEDELTSFTNDCLDKVEANGEFDFMSEVGFVVPMHAIAKLIGFRNDNEQQLMKIAYESADLVSGTKTLAEINSALARNDEISEWLEEQIAERDGESTDDLLDAVKAAIKTGQLSMAQGKLTMVTLLPAGAESTASLIGNAVRILAERPHIVSKLKENPDLLPAFIEEAGRLESPFRHHLRSVPHDTELAGVVIPAGSVLMLMWGAANRDPEKFANPTEINLERRQQHVTFGRGIHLCVGAALARMEARIVLSSLLKRNKFPSLSTRGKPEWEYSIMVRRHKRLPLSWH